MFTFQCEKMSYFSIIRRMFSLKNTSYMTALDFEDSFGKENLPKSRIPHDIFGIFLKRVKRGRNLIAD